MKNNLSSGIEIKVPLCEQKWISQNKLCFGRKISTQLLKVLELQLRECVFEISQKILLSRQGLVLID